MFIEDFSQGKKKSVDLDNIKYIDLNVYNFGMHECMPGYSYGPTIRDHYIIHYIFKGNGCFYADNKKHDLCEGQGFLIRPGKLTFYQADPSNPWHYVWVGFSGLKAGIYLEQANLTLDNPIFFYKNKKAMKKCILQMLKMKKDSQFRESRLLSHLYMFLSMIIEENGENHTRKTIEKDIRHYVIKAVEYIEQNYSREIQISEVAHFTGIVRSYLFTVFKQSMGISPQEYLIKYRINKACELMHDSLLSISDISRSVGYNDVYQFSKIFKKCIGKSPSEYRKKLL